jgi:hypothetical protein
LLGLCRYAKLKEQNAKSKAKDPVTHTLALTLALSRRERGLSF